MYHTQMDEVGVWAEDDGAIMLSVSNQAFDSAYGEISEAQAEKLIANLTTAIQRAAEIRRARTK